MQPAELVFKDGTRLEVDVPDDYVRRGRVEARLPDNAADRIASGAPLPVYVEHCYLKLVGTSAGRYVFEQE